MTSSAGVTLTMYLTEEGITLPFHCQLMIPQDSESEMAYLPFVQ